MLVGIPHELCEVLVTTGRRQAAILCSILVFQMDYIVGVCVCHCTEDVFQETGYWLLYKCQQWGCENRSVRLVMHIYISYKAVFRISGNPLCFNMGLQWQRYFLQSIQLGITRLVRKVFKELTWYTDVWHMHDAASHQKQYKITVWPIEWPFI